MHKLRTLQHWSYEMTMQSWSFRVVLLGLTVNGRQYLAVYMIICVKESKHGQKTKTMLLTIFPPRCTGPKWWRIVQFL